MKFTANSKDLKSRLKIVLAVIGSNPVIPILDNIYLELDNSTLILKGTDLETTMVTLLEVTEAQQGDVNAICVSAKTFTKLINEFQDVPITFSLDKNVNEYQLNIEVGLGQYKLQGVNASEFPKAPELDKDIKTIKIPSDVLTESITRTLPFTGEDHLRPVMTGIYLEMLKSGLIFTATDAIKLVTVHNISIVSEVDNTMILPKKAASQLLKFLPKKADDVTITYNDSNAVFVMDNFTMYCLLVDGKYPPYNSIIPKDNDKRLVVDKELLINTIKRASIFANNSTKAIIFKINEGVKDKLCILAENLDYGNSSEETIECKYESDKPITIGFNANIFMATISNIPSKNVVLEMKELNTAVNILPDWDEEDVNPYTDMSMRCLVMPVIITVNQ